MPSNFSGIKILNDRFHLGRDKAKEFGEPDQDDGESLSTTTEPSLSFSKVRLLTFRVSRHSLSRLHMHSRR